MKVRLTIGDIQRLRKENLPPDDAERLKRFLAILYQAASELGALADEGPSSISLAASALAGKFLLMARLRAVSEKEVRQLRLLEMAGELNPPWDWTNSDEFDVDARTFKAFRQKQHVWRKYIIEGFRKRGGGKCADEAWRLLYTDLLQSIPEAHDKL